MWRRALWLIGGLACRDYQEPAPFDDCQPYALACGECTFADDVADDATLLRVYRCEDADAVQYDGVAREGEDGGARDTHFYDPDTGYRLAASREYDDPVDVCGRELTVEWYGLIIEDCTVVCEIDPDLPEADPENPPC